ncbi:GGDEF domain-containing protein [Motiliproteus sediminis]|uniref:GGDEF domain-containing protein n=1 Tax=Motiliproteus sediminis TaxID=1468178 RepID=UPI001AEFCE2C|nr:GGDEF domain-containing protein [Motiliproteus sediminis]
MSAPNEHLTTRNIKRLLGGFQPSDILSARQHSPDFNATRADYITKRLRFMLLFFVAAVPAWIPVDYLTLNSENFSRISLARVALTAFLGLLYLISRSKPRPLTAHAVLVFTILSSVTFYLASMIIMATGVTETPLAGYSAMPMMVVALTGLFPVTLLFGALLAATITLSYLGLQTWLGQLATSETLNTLWVIGLVTGVTLWIQCGQLLMLLKLYRESTRDALTGLINRRVLMKQFELVMEDANAGNTGFAVLMCDLDRFKRINDNHGHLIGDKVLRQAAAVLTDNLRKSDTIARFGGEEFMAILPGLNAAEAKRLAEELRQAFEACEISDGANGTIPVTTSIGLTDYQPGERIEELLERADQLLYQAKQKGRNQVVASDTTTA